MRPLNRPMFRYGGPIKEGVMSGIKEPRQNYNRAGKVLKYIPGGQKIYNKISTSTKDIIPRTVQKIKNFYSGDPSRYGVPAAEGIKQKTLRFLKPDEKAGLLTNKYIFDRTVVPAAGGVKFAFQKAAPYATVGGLTLGGGYSLFGGDDKPNPNDPGGPKGPPSIINPPGDKKGGTGTPPPGVQLTEKEKRAQQIEKYRDIMDIKGMNKAAAYDSLIAASQAVNQAGGDLKGAIRDGSLINQIIQSTSKAFDKPAKTKDAIDTLILKGEIEKDIKASDPSTILDADYKRAKIAESKKSLNPSYNTLKAAYAKSNVKGQSGIDGAAQEYSQNNNQVFRGNIISKADFKETLDDIKKKSGNVDELTVIANWTNETIKGKNVPDGNYTVGDRIVTIQDSVVIDVE